MARRPTGPRSAEERRTMDAREALQERAEQQHQQGMPPGQAVRQAANEAEHEGLRPRPREEAHQPASRKLNKD